MGTAHFFAGKTVRWPLLVLRCGPVYPEAALRPSLSRSVPSVPQPRLTTRNPPSPPAGASFLRRHHFELIFPNLGVGSVWLTPHLDAVDPGTVRTKGAPVFDNAGDAVAGVANFNECADRKRLGQVWRRHRQVPPVTASPGGRTQHAG